MARIIPPFPRCPACPIAPGRPCPSVALRHRPLCDRVAAGREGAAAHLATLAAFLDGGSAYAVEPPPTRRHPDMRRRFPDRPDPGHRPGDPILPDWPDEGPPAPGRSPAGPGDGPGPRLGPPTGPGDVATLAIDFPTLAIMAELCPMATGSCGCAGSTLPRHCANPDRPPEVRDEDCRRCVSRSQWEAGVDAPPAPE